MTSLIERLLTRDSFELLIQIVVRAITIVLIGCMLGLAANEFHPMGLPMTLVEAKHSGVPVWVWRSLTRISPQQGRWMWQTGDVYVLDVRDRVDFSASHIPGSINLPYHEFTTAYPAVRTMIPEGAYVLIYCYGSDCGLSMRVAKRLLNLDWTNLMLLTGGFEAWEGMHYELTGDATNDATEEGTGETPPRD